MNQIIRTKHSNSEYQYSKYKPGDVFDPGTLATVSVANVTLSVIEYVLGWFDFLPPDQYPSTDREESATIVSDAVGVATGGATIPII